MKRQTPYHELPLVPSIIADTVAGRPYDGSEWSTKVRSASSVERFEGLRQQMTASHVEEFIYRCDQLCRLAYEDRADWFLKIVRGGNRGRDQLYMVIQHWLTAYLNNRERFLEE